MDNATKQIVLHQLFHALTKHQWTCGLLDHAATSLDYKDFEALICITNKMRNAIGAMQVSPDNIHYAKNAMLIHESLSQAVTLTATIMDYKLA